MGSTSHSWFSRGWWTFTGLLQRMHLAMGQEHGHKLWTCKRSQAGFGFEWETFRNNPPTILIIFIYTYRHLHIDMFIYIYMTPGFQRGEVVWFRCFSFAICACSIQHGQLPYLALIARTWNEYVQGCWSFLGEISSECRQLGFWPLTLLFAQVSHP